MNLPPPSPKQARLIWLAISGLALGTLVGLIIALIWGLSLAVQLLSPVLWPLAVAGIIAYLLDPVVDRIEKRGLSRPKAIVSVFSLALLILATIFGSVIPQIVVETQDLARRAPGYTAHLEQRIQHWMNHPPALVQKFLDGKINRGATTNSIPSATPNTANAVRENATAPATLETGNRDTLETATTWLTQNLPKVGRWLFGQVGRVASWLGVLAGLALVPVYAFYLLLEKRGIESRWTEYLPVADSRFKEELVFILRSINDYLIAFFRGQVLVAICDSVLYTIGFLLIGLPYAVLLGFAAVFLTLIPFLGAIALCAAAIIIALVQYGDWLHPLYVLIVFGVVQTLEGLVISPKIMGNRVGLHPLTIIIAVMAGTTLLGGILGGILAIPLTAVLRVLMGRYVWKKREA